MRSLKSMIGEMIVARIPALDTDDMSLVKLHGVEANGIWIESHDFTQSMMNRCDLAISETTTILFVPFSSVEYIVDAYRSTSISEFAFGVTEN